MKTTETTDSSGAKSVALRLATETSLLYERQLIGSKTAFPPAPQLNLQK